MKQIAILGCLIVSLAHQTLVAGPTNSPPSPGGSSKQDEYHKFLAETEKLPPAERKAKVKAFLESHGLTEEVMQKQQAEYRKMTQEQRAAKLQGTLTELKKKKATATLTPSEEQQLKTLEDWSKRTQHATNGLPIRNISTNKPSKTK
jgi:hypothetical protein